MPSVRLLLSGCSRAEINGGASTLFALGSWRELPSSALVVELDGTNLGATCERYVIDGSAVLVFRSSGVLNVALYRGLTSSHELYYHLSLDEGRLVVADTFRGILSTVPLGERRVPEQAVVHFLLYRTPPYGSTLISSVSRVGHGQFIEFDLFESRGVALARTSTARLESATASAADANQLVSKVLATLRHVTEELQLGEKDFNLFSGGVDSTLLQALAGAMRPLHYEIDSAECRTETEYATAAARMLDVGLEIVNVPESGYLSALEQVISASSLPPSHMQTVLADAAFQAACGTRCVCGAWGDSLFGFDSQRHYTLVLQAERFLGPLRPALLLPESSERSRVIRRLREILRLRDQLRASALDPMSLSGLFGLYTDFGMVVKLFGQSSVEERIVSRTEYVLERVSLDPTTAHGFQCELAQWVDFFSDDTIGVWQQLAAARSCPLVYVYTASEIVRLVKSIPTAIRYVHKGRSKYLLKDALRELLPTYPISQPKNSGGLPLDRYLATGPLASALRAYPRPDFLSDRDLDAVEKAGGLMAWNILMFSMWDSLVRGDPNLVPMPGTRLLEWPA